MACSILRSRILLWVGTWGAFCWGNVSEMPTTPSLFAAAASCAPSWNILLKYPSVSLSCCRGLSGFRSPDGGTPGQPVSMQRKSVKPVNGNFALEGLVPVVITDGKSRQSLSACFQETSKKQKLKKRCHLSQMAKP